MPGTGHKARQVLIIAPILIVLLALMIFTSGDDVNTYRRTVISSNEWNDLSEEEFRAADTLAFILEAQNKITFINADGVKIAVSLDKLKATVYEVVRAEEDTDRYIFKSSADRLMHEGRLPDE